MRIQKFIKNSFIDYPSHIATVVFTIGCNWKCWYCLNSPLINTNSYAECDEQEVLDFLANRVGLIDGVVICGGEPTLQPDLINFIRKVKNLGYDVKLDTNGTNPIILKKLVDDALVDYVAMDIKAPFVKYDEITGVKTEIDKVRQSIDILMNSKIDYEFRTTVTPDFSKDDILQIAQSIKGAKRYYLQAYKQPADKNLPKSMDPNNLIEYARLCNDYVPTQLH